MAYRIFIVILLFHVLLLSWAALPVFGPMALFGLGGSDPFNFVLMALGFLAGPICLVVAFWKKKALVGVILSYVLIYVGVIRDQQFWKKTNSDLCQKLRSDPYCTEVDTGGFSCSEPSELGNFMTGSRICRSSDS